MLADDPQPQAMPKVFGIGFQKTGTKSLRRALRLLGYRVTGPNGFQDREIALTYRQMTVKLSHEFDAFQDNPWPLVYRDMHALWPDAKFILTRRAPQPWIASVIGHFGRGSTPMRQLVYGVGSPVGNEARYIQRMHDHEQEVLAYFADFPDALLVMDIYRGDGYAELCRFLDKPVITDPFPHENAASTRKKPAPK